MELYSTKNKAARVNFKQALFRSLPPDNGLYMPARIPLLDREFIERIGDYSFQETAFTVARALLQDTVEDSALRALIDEAVNFPAPLREVRRGDHVLELFHGPSLAFKDFGARFMSRMMAYFLEKEEREVHILVATSGDTGGAVALGFYGVPNIRVTILYPSGKVSPVQEKQLTTLGSNITALEVKGTFDDCQRMVKEAFLDKDLNRRFFLSSANSINIARLIPQTFYYFNAVAQLRKAGNERPVVFSVPSGNFGNLTAGVLARKMGLPVHRFVAATNINDEVPRYLETGVFEPSPSRHTLSNAMDVGNPSNFARMLDLYEGDVNMMRNDIAGYRFTDEETRAAIEEVFTSSGYVMCPHTAVAYLGLQQWKADHPEQPVAGIFLSTAHPCKFPEVYNEKQRADVILPPQVQDLMGREKRSVPMTPSFEAFKKYLLEE